MSEHTQITISLSALVLGLFALFEFSATPKKQTIDYPQTTIEQIRANK